MSKQALKVKINELADNKVAVDIEVKYQQIAAKQVMKLL